MSRHKKSRILFKHLYEHWHEIPYGGICSKLTYLRTIQKINIEELQLMQEVLEFNKPVAIRDFGAMPHSLYWWAIHDSISRINFVKHLAGVKGS